MFIHSYGQQYLFSSIHFTHQQPQSLPRGRTGSSRNTSRRRRLVLPYPRVCQGVPKPHALARVAVKESYDEFLGVRRCVRGEADDAAQDALVQAVLLGVGGVRRGGRVFRVAAFAAAEGAGNGCGPEGRVPDEKFVRQHADGPAVHRLCWCCVYIYMYFVRWSGKMTTTP